MGVVYRAAQEEPVRREVALKVLRAAADSPAVLSRFETERQTLARLDHPNIARLLDAASTGDGRPYFAMELVRGAPLTDYCREAQVDVRGRLRLFLEVCRAVRHAHRSGVIHRDLKPSNILVTLVHDQTVPKVIDFGIAKALGDEAGGTEARTRTGQIVGTLEYMSPEQAKGAVHALDTRSDVYALGVILYELLADRLPHDFADQPLHEAVRRIVEEPPRPLRKTATTATGKVDADLDTLVGKCLEKDPERRYGSAAELCEDLERYLSSRPILARPPSALYTLRKLMGRHRVAFGAAAAVVVALAAGLVGTSLGLVRASQARAAAEEEAATANAVSDFLLKVFDVASPGEARGKTITAREILDAGAERLREELKDRPRIQARLMSHVGAVYRNLGMIDAGRSLLEEALATQRSVLGPDHADTLSTLARLGWLEYEAGHLDQAEDVLRDALAAARRTLRPENETRLDMMNSLAVTLWKRGRLDEAGALYAEALEIEQRVYGDEHVATQKTLNNLGILYASQGRNKEALELFTKALEIRRRLYGDTHPLLVTATRNLAMMYGQLGDLKSGHPLYEESLAIAIRLYGEDHQETYRAQRGVANSLLNYGRYQEAESVLRKILPLQRRLLGEDHQYVLESMFYLGMAQLAGGKANEADVTYGETLRAFRRVYGPDHPETLLVARGQASVSLALGRLSEAETSLRAIAGKMRESGDSGTPALIETMWRLGETFAAGGRLDEAERTFLECRAGFIKSLGPTHPSTLGVTYSLASLAARRGDPGQALSLLREAIDGGWTGSRLDEDSEWSTLRGRSDFQVLAAQARPRPHE
jgi:tetratricopeptide (TPR) repeat protein